MSMKFCSICILVLLFSTSPQVKGQASSTKIELEVKSEQSASQAALPEGITEDDLEALYKELESSKRQAQLAIEQAHMAIARMNVLKTRLETYTNGRREDRSCLNCWDRNPKGGKAAVADSVGSSDYSPGGSATGVGTVALSAYISNAVYRESSLKRSRNALYNRLEARVASNFWEGIYINTANHERGLSISKQFPLQSLRSEAALYVEDTADSATDLTGLLVNVVANNSLPAGRSVFQINRYGGVLVWDHMGITPTGGGVSQWCGVPGAMLCVGSDLGPNGLNLALHNVANHDFLAMNDSNGNQIGIANPQNPRRFTFTGPGLLVFGNKVNTAPALKSSGAILTVRLGDNSGYTDLAAKNIQTVGGTFSGDGSGLTSLDASQISSGTMSSARLDNSTIILNTGQGLSGGGTVALGGSITLNNTGVTSLAGTPNQINASSSSGGVILGLPQDIGTTSKPTFSSLNVSLETHDKGISIRKKFPSLSLSSEAALQVEDTTDSFDNKGLLFNVVANKTPPVGRSVFQISRYGEVKVWDFMGITPTASTAQWCGVPGAMLCVGSDLGPDGLNLALHNVANHDFMAMNDSNGNQLGITNPLNPRRFTFTGPGLLVFGNKVNTAPALKPSGASLTVRLGDNSAYADFAANSIQANGGVDINGGDSNGLRLRRRSIAGAPSAGTWSTDTIIIDASGKMWICTLGGTPGTWEKVGSQ